MLGVSADTSPCLYMNASSCSLFSLLIPGHLSCWYYPQSVSLTRAPFGLCARAGSDPYSKDTWAASWPPGHHPTAVFRRQQSISAESATFMKYHPPNRRIEYKGRQLDFYTDRRFL